MDLRCSASSIDQLQFTRVDINHQAMHRNFWQIRTATNHVDNLFHIDIYIVKRAEPPYQAIYVIQLLFLYQLLRIYS